MRDTITVVLPEPAPAKISSGPSAAKNSATLFGIEKPVFAFQYLFFERKKSFFHADTPHSKQKALLTQCFLFW